MKVLLGTDLLYDFLKRDKYYDGIKVFFKFMSSLHIDIAVDFSSIAILTHFVSPVEFSKLNNVEFIKAIPKKAKIISILETSFNKKPIIDQKARRSLLSQMNLLICNYCDFIVSENLLLHELAKQLNLDDRVYSIEGFMEKCVAENRSVNLGKEHVTCCKFGELNLDDPFFNSFKEDYKPAYVDWCHKKKEDDVYVSISSKGKIKALLKLKIEDINENYIDIEPILKPAKRLKICSLKVSYTGSKLGERFMMIIFDKAIHNNVDEIYVTIKKTSKSKIKLIKLLTFWGFKLHGMKNHNELVYIRNLKHMVVNNFCKNYPFHKNIDSNFIVPLHKKYADKLLSNTQVSSKTIDYEPYNNVIQKVLILHENNTDLKTGSILLFYQKSSDKKERRIISIGLVENVYKSIYASDKFLLRCRKRSNLSNLELSSCWHETKSEKIIVDFLLVYSFDNIISSDFLDEIGLNTSSYKVQTAHKISNEVFYQIIKGTLYEKNIIIN